METGKTRNYGIEYLRIISMILIIFSHMKAHSNIIYNLSSLSLGTIYLQIIGFGGAIACGVFIYISGYYSYEKKFNTKRICKLIAEMEFYALLIFFILKIFGLSGGITLADLFPLFFSDNWFLICYILFYSFVPLINILTDKLNKNQFRALVIILTIVWALIPTITTKSYMDSGMDSFFVFFMLGRYFGKYGYEEKRWTIIFILNLLFILSTIFVFISLGWFLNKDNMINSANYFTRINRITSIVFCVSIFKLFANLKVNTNITRISKCILGVYLIHDNFRIRQLLWNNWVPIKEIVTKPFFIPCSILIVFFIFILCVIIDNIRICLFEKPLFKLLDKKFNKIDFLLNDLLYSR